MTEIEAERERLAKMIEGFALEREAMGERVSLAIAARAVRRGRMLTPQEQLENLAKGLADLPDDDEETETEK